jgi:hypothetical protein
VRQFVQDRGFKDINDVDNGAWLPTGKKAPNITGAYKHEFTFDNESFAGEYFQRLEDISWLTASRNRASASGCEHCGRTCLMANFQLRMPSTISLCDSAGAGAGRDNPRPGGDHPVPHVFFPPVGKDVVPGVPELIPIRA